MAKNKSKNQFHCQDCGAIAAKWSGQCADCGQWNTLVEQTNKRIGVADVSRHAGIAPGSDVQKLATVDVSEVTRFSSSSAELDRVLGGGIVPGAVVLIGGDPGIGKSTLLLQYLCQISAKYRVLYVSAEESAEQVAMRARRLQLPDTDMDIMAENRLDEAFAVCMRLQPDILVIDSIQTVYSDALTAAPGSVSQVRECAAQLVRLAKQTGTTIMMVGHVTKEGAIAGPRVLEHMVDSVLYFEGDSSSSFRLIRAIKNRYGAVNEIGVFAMTEKGLLDVANPSALFVNRQGGNKPGSVVLATQEGTRPILVEVQALVDESMGSHQKRLCVGLEANRLAMLLAVSSRHLGISLSGMDVFANVAGGLKVLETGADLALLLAIISSLRNQPLGNELVVFGEVGLAGELRPVQRGQDRLNEAQKLGFKRALVPKANRPQRAISGLEVIAVASIEEAIDSLF